MRARSLFYAWLATVVGCKPFSRTVAADDFAAERARMVTAQLTAPGRDLTHARVLAAMGKVPRHEFVPVELRARAYADRPLPIGHGQTISQPFVVAFMTAQLDPQPGARILEIGTGSGYQAAVLAELGAEVYSIEIVEPLAQRAGKMLARLGYEKVHVKAGDGYRGWPEHAPFDAIIVTCAPNHVPEALVAQLKNGGRLVVPVGDGSSQEIYLLEKEAGVVRQTAVLPVRFVPMTGAAEKKRP